MYIISWAAYLKFELSFVICILSGNPILISKQTNWETKQNKKQCFFHAMWEPFLHLQRGWEKERIMNFPCCSKEVFSYRDDLHVALDMPACRNASVRVWAMTHTVVKAEIHSHPDPCGEFQNTKFSLQLPRKNQKCDKMKYLYMWLVSCLEAELFRESGSGKTGSLQRAFPRASQSIKF